MDKKLFNFIIAFSLVCGMTFSFNIWSDEIPNFKLSSFGTKTPFELSQYLGKKTILINFWATWCPSCIAEIDELNQLKKKYPDVIFLAINAGERENIIKKFLAKHPFDLIILIDENRDVSTSLKTESLPRTIVISPEKKIIFDGHRPPKSF
jgi:thiol-disulfide isomerase/thioredoxin